MKRVSLLPFDLLVHNQVKLRNSENLALKIAKYSTYCKKLHEKM